LHDADIAGDQASLGPGHTRCAEMATKPTFSADWRRSTCLEIAPRYD
jgi:hypothetical protein